MWHEKFQRPKVAALNCYHDALKKGQVVKYWYSYLCIKAGPSQPLHCHVLSPIKPARFEGLSAHFKRTLMAIIRLSSCLCSQTFASGWGWRWGWWQGRQAGCGWVKSVNRQTLADWQAKQTSHILGYWDTRDMLAYSQNTSRSCRMLWLDINPFARRSVCVSV